MKLTIFNCKCGESAEWLVWYKDCGGLYNYRCTDCAVKDMKKLTMGTDAYPVVCIRSIEEAVHIDRRKRQST